MKLIIAGGRDYQLTQDDYTKLDTIKARVEVVVSGGATGADRCGEIWARRNKLPLKIFPADWKQYGKKAGPIRNMQMAEYADAVALFPGGSGTESMRTESLKRGLEIFDFRPPNLSPQMI